MITTHQESVKGGVWAEARVYLFDGLLLKKNAVLGLRLNSHAARENLPRLVALRIL